MRELLKTEHLSVSFFTKAGEVEAVRDVSLTVEEGEVLAIVGESGCGKSALCKSIMKLLPKTAKIKSGKILADGIDITDYTQRNMSRLRGSPFFHDISGSDDIPQSDNDHRETDWRSCADP